MMTKVIIQTLITKEANLVLLITNTVVLVTAIF
jgi:hypothetical protein